VLIQLGNIVRRLIPNKQIRLYVIFVGRLQLVVSQKLNIILLEGIEMSQYANHVLKMLRRKLGNI